MVLVLVLASTPRIRIRMVWLLLVGGVGGMILV